MKSSTCYAFSQAVPGGSTAFDIEVKLSQQGGRLKGLSFRGTGNLDDLFVEADLNRPLIHVSSLASGGQDIAGLDMPFATDSLRARGTVSVAGATVRLTLIVEHDDTSCKE